MRENLNINLLENIIAATKDAIIITGPLPKDGGAPKIIYVNKAFSDMTGYSRSFAVGNTPQFLQGIKTDRKELSRLRKALRKGESFETTIINYKQSGEAFWNNFTISPVINESGECTNWIGIERDVTQQKNKELEKELLAQISCDFSIENNYAVAANKLCKTVCEFGQFDIVELWTRGLEEDKLSLLGKNIQNKIDASFYGQNILKATFKKSIGLPGAVWKNKEQVIWDKSDMSAWFVRNEAAEIIGLNAVLGIPLFFNQQVKGVLLIGTKNGVNHLNNYTHIFGHLKTFLGAEIRRKKVEHKLSNLFQAIPDIICLMDSDGKILKMNQAGLNLLGHSESLVLHKPLDDFILPGDNQNNQPRFDEITRGEKNLTFENRIINKDGKLIWLSWSCNSSDDDGYIYASAKDITTEKELKQLNHQATSMAKIGSWELDLINNKLYWSDMVHELHKTDPETFEPNVTDAILYYHEDYRPLVRKAVDRCIKEGKSFDLEAIIVTSQHEQKWIRAIGNAQFASGKCRRIFGSLQDINDRKLASEELRKSYVEKTNILESIGEAFFTIDKSGTVTYWNNQAENLFQTPRRKVLNTNLWQTNPVFRNSVFFDRCKEVLASGNAISFEEYLNELDRWFEASIFPGDEGLSVYIQDVTRRKKSELQMTVANERFQKVTEATTDAIWDWDIKENSLYWGSSYKKIFGYQIENETTSIDVWTSLIHPDDIGKVSLSLNTLLSSNNNSWEEEYRYQRSDGTYATVVDRGMVIRNEENKPVRMVGAMTDISERKEYEEQLLSLNKELSAYAKELERKNEDLDSFAFITSHDLQEPLRMISSFLSLLQKKYGNQLDEKANTYIDFATKGAERMKNMILDLLKYSRSSQNETAYERVEVKEIIDNFKLLRNKVIVDRSVSISFDQLPAIHTCRPAITQVFHSLLDNAIKYTKKDVHPNITIHVTESNSEWEFAIEDNGIGIEPKYHQQVFNVFKRLHSHDEYTGTGIGLSITKKQIEHLKGRIWIESKPGIGSTFYFSIPKINQPSRQVLAS